jgi:hypothetical protein
MDGHKGSPTEDSLTTGITLKGTDNVCGIVGIQHPALLWKNIAVKAGEQPALSRITLYPLGEASPNGKLRDVRMAVQKSRNDQSGTLPHRGSTGIFRSARAFRPRAAISYKSVPVAPESAIGPKVRATIFARVQERSPNNFILPRGPIATHASHSF